MYGSQGHGRISSLKNIVKANYCDIIRYTDSLFQECLFEAEGDDITINEKSLRFVLKSAEDFAESVALVVAVDYFFLFSRLQVINEAAVIRDVVICQGTVKPVFFLFRLRGFPFLRADSQYSCSPV